MANKTMGETICELRKKAGMTQSVLAEKLNVTDKAVSKWERDLSCPDINSIPHLAEVLNVSISEIMQAKTETKKETKFNEMVSLVLKAIPLAMGVATLVTSILKQIDSYSAFAMLGVGMICLGINSFRD
jgi:transcriptional regulator with XRE-family HTH domain